uniref:Uncharacterized protein n=1 Tax=Micrurus spixii TaxID=129469 RepID=A0A2D4LYX0_9SAUR
MHPRVGGLKRSPPKFGNELFLGGVGPSVLTYLGLVLREVQASQLLHPHVWVAQFEHIVIQGQDAHFVKLELVGRIWGPLSMVPRIQAAQKRIGAQQIPSADGHGHLCSCRHFGLDS